MGQKITTKLIDKSRLDNSRYRLYVVMLKLILPDIFLEEEKNYLNENYN